MQMNYLILLCFSGLQYAEGLPIAKMDLQYQIKNYAFKKPENDKDGPFCYVYGFFTRYNPLIEINQLGDIGILDSNCYHIFNIRDTKDNNINFLYYDCVDYQKKQIQKTYTFVGEDTKIYKHTYLLNTFEYESYWYFLGVIVALAEKKVIITAFKNGQEFDTQEYSLSYQNYDTDSSYLIGGSLQINFNQTLFNPEISIFSYFPGNMRYYLPSTYNMKDNYDISVFGNRNFLCICTSNDIPNIPDTIISNLNQEYFISQNPNCDQFFFTTWIRIKEKIFYEKEIYYQLIKLSSHFQNPKLVNDNLSAFSLYYKLTQSLNQIIITTYSYTFPTINIDFSDNPFLIRQTFDIDMNIQLWHFLIVKKSKYSLLVTINFYEGRKVKEYSFESNVNHFNLIRFKVTSGNILQSINYLTIQLINMALYNCDIEINPELCHLSCLECDGPTKYDCLSCYSTSNRIYNQKQKACVCQYGKIDIDGECKDFHSFQLNLSQGNEKKFQCTYGYFEFEDQCWKCPSKIKERLITCIECITNPKTWIKNPYCQYNYVANNNQVPFTKQDEGIQQYFFDGNDLKVSENSEEQSDIYSDYIQTFAHFSNFCLKCKKTIYPKCFIFSYCFKCQIQISQPICTYCWALYQLIDGICLNSQHWQVPKVIV
ncbi:unnamed protein product (macronuclear) [Paramecium tetraurelia]|uniref:Uncharacterized protein n=1 Tax=Paramecium tetraurelia TaxID=5888 RepID=A0CX95_PARTE|nr:uncharacterized protein GSPATT00001616001 [Paramecium tetraurelia]CAK75412.1 unnamed protein product [Paramecium tetraurelia]|eukprot:XP_001442809.1 hypothetical protein (macronuclear) [Paramecium tetraurelia strain d4-2]